MPAPAEARRTVRAFTCHRSASAARSCPRNGSSSTPLNPMAGVIDGFRCRSRAGRRRSRCRASRSRPSPSRSSSASAFGISANGTHFCGCDLSRSFGSPVGMTHECFYLRRRITLSCSETTVCGPLEIIGTARFLWKTVLRNTRPAKYA